MIKIRAHEIQETQRRLIGQGRDVTQTHGPEVEANVQTVIEQIKRDPNTLIEITDTFGSICSNQCLQKLQKWHHYEGPEIKEYEEQEAHRLGLKIGEIRPGREIFHF